MFDLLLGLIGPGFADSISTQMKADLNRDYMRLLQFVKIFAEPNLDMLCKGSGIYCRENQKTIDGIMPVA